MLRPHRRHRRCRCPRSPPRRCHLHRRRAARALALAAPARPAARAAASLPQRRAPHRLAEKRGRVSGRASQLRAKASQDPEKAHRLRCAARSFAASSSFRSRASRSTRDDCPSCLRRRASLLSARASACARPLGRPARCAPVLHLRVRAQVLRHAALRRRKEARAALLLMALGGRPRRPVRRRHCGGDARGCLLAGDTTRECGLWRGKGRFSCNGAATHHARSTRQRRLQHNTPTGTSAAQQPCIACHAAAACTLSQVSPWAAQRANSAAAMGHTHHHKSAAMLCVPPASTRAARAQRRSATGSGVH